MALTPRNQYVATNLPGLLTSGADIISGVKNIYKWYKFRKYQFSNVSRRNMDT